MQHTPGWSATRCSLFALLATALAACAADSPSSVAPRSLLLAQAKGNADTPVHTYVADSDTSVSAILQIRSDMLGAYTNSSTLTSEIQAIGAWLLDSQSPRNSARTLFLDFGQPIAGSGPNGGDPMAVPTALYKVHAISKCNVYNNSMWTLAPGATMPCPLHIAFSYSGVSYAVQMNPNPTGADPDGAPETQWASITCLTPPSGTGACREWKLTPSATYIASDGSLKYRNVARLIKYVSTRNGTTNVNQGDFYFSFAIRVTNP